MADASTPADVVLVCGMISADRGLFNVARERLEGAFGPAAIVSEVFPFDLTHYYDHEMGSPLWRRFVAMERPVSPGVLADVKLATHEMERQFAAELAGQGPRRPINLDPGYVAPSKVVLASMKNFAHRIYLSRGVWAEVTMMYRKGRWQAMEWTFPDFASGRYGGFLTAARELSRDTGGASEEVGL